MENGNCGWYLISTSTTDPDYYVVYRFTALRLFMYRKIAYTIYVHVPNISITLYMYYQRKRSQVQDPLQIHHRNLEKKRYHE